VANPPSPAGGAADPPAEGAAVVPPPESEAVEAGPDAGLDAQITGIINANSTYQVGVALIDLSDGVVHSYGVTDKFVAASTAKILAAAAYYHLAETGVVSLAAPMAGSTAAVRIQQMVQQSDNQAWDLVVGGIGYQALDDYAASLGIDYYRPANLLTPEETAITLELLYTGQLLNEAHTEQLLSYMQDTNYESLIPAAVAAGIEVFHKYGLLNGYLHDASILAQGTNAYVFVVYTLGQDTNDIPARTWIIHQLTQAVVAHLF
jgi:beta-lactamase class A